MTKRTATALNYLLFSLLLVTLNIAHAQQDRGFIWEVKRKNSLVYLMGSIHFANPDFYPLRDEIETAFNRTDNLVVEIDIAAVDPIQTQMYLMQEGTYQGNETIRDNVSPKTFRMLEKYLEKRGLPQEMFLRYKPGMLVMTLTSMELMRMGLSPDQGIDVHFLSHARGRKNILELETMEQQLELMLNLGKGDQVLRQTLEEFDTYPQLMRSLIDSWKRGDTEQLEELLITKPLRDYPGSRPSFEKLFIQRNLQMAKKIKTFLNSGGSYFVVVGAGHLVGKGSIVDLLQQAGYRVRQL